MENKASTRTNKTTRKPRVAWLLTHRIQYFVNLIDTLHKRGNIEVALYLGCAPGLINDKEFGKMVSWDNRTSTSFPEHFLHSVDKKALPGMLKSFSPSLATELDSWKPDYLYINGYTDAIAWQGFAWAMRHSRPFALRCDGDTVVKKASLKSSVRRKVAAFMTSRAHRVTYQGRSNRDFWMENGASESQLEWVPCVPDSEIYRRRIFKTPADRDAFRGKFDVSPSEIVAVVNGKLIDRKRPMDAIEALAKLKDRNFRLWFLGSGELEESLVARTAELSVAGKATFLGFRNQSEIPEILQAADFLLHPSSLDPWPYSILEAAISGLALVLSDTTGSYPDWMAPPIAGSTFRSGDVNDMVKVIGDFLDDPAKLSACAHNAFMRASEYTETAFCDIFEDFIFQACS
jgi:glycosyltransferase involved in cell wall biosynthesis